MKQSILIFCFGIITAGLYGQSYVFRDSVYRLELNWNPDWDVQTQSALVYNVNDNTFCYELAQFIISMPDDDSTPVDGRDSIIVLMMIPDIALKRKNHYSKAEDNFWAERGLFHSFLFDNLVLQDHNLLPTRNRIVEGGLIFFGKEIAGDTIKACWKSRKQIGQELNLYLNNDWGSLLFAFKEDKFSDNYNYKTYEVNRSGYYSVSDWYNRSPLTLIKVDTTQFSADFPVFHYQIGGWYYYEERNYKVYSPTFLYLSFCPQIGIISYDYPQEKVKVRLESIDGFPPEYYVKNHICITPFAEIK